MRQLYIYLMFLIIYSFLGYIYEVFYQRIIFKKWVNPGFLHGPYFIVRGLFSLIVIYLLNGYYNDPLVIFVFGCIISSLFEYYTSYLLERVFKCKFWDYSGYKYNINGRININKNILDGLLALVIIYCLNPLLKYVFSFVDTLYLKYISLGLLLIILLDFIFSFFEAKRICDIANHMELILNEYVKNKNIKLNKIKMRLIYAYPYLINNDRVVKRLYKLKKDFSKRKNL